MVFRISGVGGVIGQVRGLEDACIFKVWGLESRDWDLRFRFEGFGFGESKVSGLTRLKFDRYII